MTLYRWTPKETLKEGTLNNSKDPPYLITETYLYLLKVRNKETYIKDEERERGGKTMKVIHIQQRNYHKV